MESYQELKNPQSGKPDESLTTAGDSGISIDTGGLKFKSRIGLHAAKSRRVRICVFVCVLVAVIVGICVGTKKVISSLEETLPESHWYESAVGYQIFPRSFQDSDGDGIGDLKGIINRLDYLEWLNIDVIWLGALYPSPFKDIGLDITDFTAIDPKIGDLVDFQTLIQGAHSKGIKVVIEFVPNQSSEDHFWFQQSRRGKNDPYSNFYIWADGIKEGEPPNDWKDSFGNPSWEYVADRQQWFHHSFHNSEPSLNFDDPHIETALTKAFRFWVDQGIDGVYIRHVNHILGTSDIFDDQNEFVHTDYPVMSNSTRVKSLIRKWRQVLTESVLNGGDPIKLLVVDSMDMEILNTNIKFTTSMYGTDTEPLADYPFNYALFDIQKHYVTGHTIRYLVESWLDDYRPYNAPTNWALGSAQISRIATRYEPRLLAAISILIIALPGSPLLYYGDEIGMHDVWHNDTQENVPYAPMQWNSDVNAGFTPSNVDSWTSIDNTSAQNNVEIQQDNKTSLLRLIRNAIKLRREEPRLVSPRDSVHLYGMHSNKNLLVFVRHHEKRSDHTSFFFAVNIGEDVMTADFQFLVSSTRIPDRGTVVLSTDPSLQEQVIDLRAVKMDPAETIVVAFN